MKIIDNRTEFGEVIANNETVFIDFDAGWCRLSKAVLPTLEELNKEYNSKETFVKIDVDNHIDLSIEFNVRSIPDIFIIQDVQLKDQFVGILSKEHIVKRITHLISCCGDKGIYGGIIRCIMWVCIISCGEIIA